ncbi:POT-type proton-dependent oligopeptide transporter, partial [Aeromonas hydrophila]
STAYGWQAAFVGAGISMLLSLVIQVTLAQRFLGDIGRVTAAQRAAALRTTEQKAPLTKQEVDRIKVILVLGLFTIIFWAGFEQAGGLMNLYTQEYTDRMIGSFEVPTAWFQSLNPFFIITLAPVVAAIWIKLGKKEPNS